MVSRTAETAGLPSRLPLSATAPTAVAGRTRERQIVMHTPSPAALWADSVRGNQRATEIAVPMVVSSHLIGVLTVRAQHGMEFEESQLNILSTLADLIGVAVHNVRYYHQAQELAALEERTRLARELHDSVSQALYGIGLGAQTMRKWFGKDERLVKESLDYILTLAEAGLTEMRALIFELRPESLENEGLITALAKQAASLQARHGIDVRLALCDEPRLPLNVKEGLYRVAREAMHNVVKHAAASQVTLCITTTLAELHLEVIDDGLGFDTGADFPGHLGLHSMRERVTGMGGQLSVRSAPGAGTTVAVRLPLASYSPSTE